MGRKYQVISGDGHLETPPDFVAFLPEKSQDRAPKLISLPDGGGDAWLMEGMPLTYASQNLRGRGKVKFAGQSYFKDDGSRTDGAGDGLQRLQEQDEDGLDAELLFVPVFASRFLEKIPDHARTSRWCRPTTTGWPATARSHPTGSSATRWMPISGIDDAIAELEQVRTHGLQVGAAAQLAQRWQRSEARRRPLLGEGARAGDRLSPHMSFAGVMNVGGPRHDTSQWPVEAGMTQHRAAVRPTRWRSSSSTAPSSGSRS